MQAQHNQQLIQPTPVMDSPQKNPEQAPQISKEDKFLNDFFNGKMFQLKKQILLNKEEIKAKIQEMRVQFTQRTKPNNQTGIFNNNWHIVSSVSNNTLQAWQTLISWLQQIKAKIFKINISLPTLNIIDKITQIRFTKLKKLQLSENNIYTIESLYRNEWNELQILIITKNHINSIKSLRKIKAPMLNQLHLNDNHIMDMEYLIELDCPYLQALRLQWYPSFHHKENPQQGQSIEWIFRLQSSKISFIRMHGCQRIVNHSNDFKLREKWVGCYIGNK